MALITRYGKNDIHYLFEPFDQENLNKLNADFEDFLTDQFYDFREVIPP